MALMPKKTVTGVTAKLAKVATDLRAIEAEAEYERAEAAAKSAAAAVEAEAARTIAGNIEKLLGQ